MKSNFKTSFKLLIKVDFHKYSISTASSLILNFKKMSVISFGDDLSFESQMLCNKYALPGMRGSLFLLLHE